MSDDTPYDEDAATKDFYRILDEIFGAFDREKTTPDEWLANANRWFINEFRRFSKDVEEIMEKIPNIVQDTPEMALDPGADMIMDAWIDGRHYEIVISRLPDDEALPEPELRLPVDALDEDDLRFDDDFVEEWA